ncbi:MAG: cytochrome c, partial [Bdellovibrionales bacterium]|nr:cytochrome c [Bdellovibrionales bacterium]
EFDFGHPSGKPVPPKNRIHKDPVSCISCHAGSEFDGKVSLKPNWPEYFQWSDCKEDRGIQFYGGNDDNMGPGQFRSPFTQKYNCGYGEAEKNTRKEQEDFLKFREKQKGNECFNSLPWPKNAPETKDPTAKGFEKKWSYKYYPYAEASQEMNTDDKAPKNTNPYSSSGSYQNYALRTNLRFTDTYAHLMSKRIANLLKKNPNYETVKYLLVMEQAGCNVTDEEMSAVNELMPGLNLSKSTPVDAEHSTGRQTPLLFNFSKIAGLAEKDWTMEFQEKKKPDYVSAIINDGAGFGDLTINKVVGGEVLKDISEANNTVAEVSKEKLTRGITNLFSSRFSCIDDLGGGVKLENDYGNPPPGGKKFCDVLREENEKNIAKIKEIQANCTDCKKINLPKPARKLASTIEETVKKLNADSIARGKKLVELDSRGKCVMCHSASVDMLPKDFRFIPSSTDPKKKESIAVIQARKDEIEAKLKDRLLKNKTMPPPPIGAELSDKDREDVNAYLLSLAVGEK